MRCEDEIGREVGADAEITRELNRDWRKEAETISTVIKIILMIF